MMQADKKLFYVIIFLLTTILNGCAVQQQTVHHKPPLRDQGELYFYLQPLPQEMKPLSFTVSSIAVIPDQGEPIPIMTSEMVIRGEEYIGRQKRMATGILPPGMYKGVVLTISQADIKTEEGPAGLLPPAGPIRLKLEFFVQRGMSQALFLVLTPEYLVREGYKFTPRFVLGKPFLLPKNYTGFVSYPEENVVTVINKKNLEVVQVIHTGAGPKGMALDQENGIVYVAASGADTIEVINLTTMSIIGRIRLHFGDEPVDIALTPDGRTLLTANAGSGTISFIDTRSLSERNRLILDPDPVWIVIGQDGDMAYVLHSLSNSISLLDIQAQSLVTAITFEETPWRGTLNRDGDKLYVVSQYSSDLLVVDIQSLAVTRRIFIGGGATSVVKDPRNDLVYIAKNTGEVVTVDQDAGMFIDSFPVERKANYIALDGEENTFFVLSEDRNIVQKFNLVSKREINKLETETSCYALVVMGELK